MSDLLTPQELLRGFWSYQEGIPGYMAECMSNISKIEEASERVLYYLGNVGTFSRMPSFGEMYAMLPPKYA